VSGSVNSRVVGVRVGGMASTQARMTARARARAAQQKVLADRKRRDEANMGSLTAFFTAAEQIDAATLAMARALDDIRAREGTLGAAATLAGITTGEARKLLAVIAAAEATSASTDTGDDTLDSDADAGTQSRDGSALNETSDSTSTGDATTSKAVTRDSVTDVVPATGQG
jgi:hypothetical protein